MQGAWTASFYYNYHYTKKFFQLMVGMGNGIIAHKVDKGESSSLMIFFHPAIRTTFQLKKFYFSGELVNAFYYYSKDYYNEGYDAKAFFVSTLGVTYKAKNIEVGAYYQVNLSADLSQYAHDILGLQGIFRLPKQEEYLKTRTK